MVSFVGHTVPLFAAAGREDPALCNSRVRVGLDSFDLSPALVKLQTISSQLYREPWAEHIDALLSYLDLICLQAQREGKLYGFFASTLNESDGPIAVLFPTNLHSSANGERLYAVLVQQAPSQMSKPFTFFRMADILSTSELASSSLMQSALLLPPCNNPPSLVTFSHQAVDFVFDRVRCLWFLARSHFLLSSGATHRIQRLNFGWHAS